MLVLDQSRSEFADDVDPAVRYRLPSGLAPFTGSDGVPQVTLSRGQGSGLLQLRLAPVWPASRSGDRPVNFKSGRFRLLMRGPSSTETGEWRPAELNDDAVVDRSVSLTAVEAAIAQRLGKGGGDVVDVEVELSFTGFAPVYPWLVQCDGTLLRNTVASLVGSAPASWDKVEAAFLGLSKEIFEWQPLEPGALPPPIDSALLALANHAKPVLLEEAEGGWQVRASVPPRVAFSLAVPRLATKAVGMRWSFSDFLAAQTDPARHLMDIGIPAPLEAATLLVVNDLPLAADGIQRVEVQVRTGGPSGHVSHVFLPGQSSSARLRFIRETWEDLDLRWRALVTVSTARGPAVAETPEAKTGLMLEITRQNTGLKALRFHADKDTFAIARSFEIVAGARTILLTSAKPEGWVVGRTPPATCPVAAVTESGQKVPLGEFAIADGLTVDAAMLGVGEMVPFAFRAPAQLGSRAAYLAVQMEGASWRTVDLGSELKWAVRRNSRLELPRLRYRTRHVPRLAGGVTGPMVESDWKIASATSVDVEI